MHTVSNAILNPRARMRAAVLVLDSEREWKEVEKYFESRHTLFRTALA